jgi:hypothetical protein
MDTDRDEFYGDILDGLSVWLDSPLIRDVLRTVSRFDEPDLGHALNRNQVGGKLWLADTLRQAAGARYGTAVVLGGWFGVLGGILLGHRELAVERVVSIDIDPRCLAIAESMNARFVETGRFEARTGDMLTLDYSGLRDLAPAGRGAEGVPEPAPDVLINTVCEHVAPFAEWFAAIPAGQLLVLQSNDYTAIHDHVNCVPDLAAFRAQAPLAELLFAGERRHKRYRRFMLIGRK